MMKLPFFQPFLRTGFQVTLCFPITLTAALLYGMCTGSASAHDTPPQHTTACQTTQPDGACRTAEYRCPSADDMQWLFTNTDMPSPSGIIQASFVTPKTAASPVFHSASRNAAQPAANGLTPHCKPCEAAISSPLPPPPSLQSPPIKQKGNIPPAPTLSSTKNPNITGVSQDSDGSEYGQDDTVIRIAPVVNEDDSPVLQMADKQVQPPKPPQELPPPASEPDKSVASPECPQPSAASAANSADLLPQQQKAGGNVFKKDIFSDNTFSNDSDIAKNDIFKKRVYIAPDMIGAFTPLPQQNFEDSGRYSGSRMGLPNMLLSRPNITEHFNAAVQNRIWADYRHWNDADPIPDIAGYKNKGIEQFTFGLEKKFAEVASVEFRVPLLYRYASFSAAGLEDETAVELGNITAFLKGVIKKTKRSTLTGGIGATFPTAKDYWSTNSRLSNELYYLVSFIGLQWHPNETAFGHLIAEWDTPLNENKLQGTNLDGQQVIRTGIQLGHWIYQCEPCRLGAFAEADYTVVTGGSAGVSDGTITVNTLRSRSHTLTGAAGLSAVFNKMTVTNSVIVPLEHSGQLLSIGYNLSLKRVF
ncbi:MAG: hypothetical protein LBT46_09390 [Planctomycetaceae bacterium]|jgi:hypothetical protein|nr:hypothetical protein [Planctomycetaceae bacterium]